MPPLLLDLRSADDSRDVIHRAVQALVEGKLVAFPTETVYLLAASALCEEAVARQLEARQIGREHGLALGLKDADEALDYVPRMPALAQRLARRCWPGPVTLVLADRDEDSASLSLPPAVRAAVAPEGEVGLQVSAHHALQDVLRMMAGPVTLCSAGTTSGGEALTAHDVLAGMSDQVQMVLDDGRSHYGQPASVVRVTDQNFEVLRSGVVSDQALARLSSLLVVFVCTGNTCRSPMAETMFRQLAAARKKCRIEELADQGVVVASAGLAATSGGGPSPEAVKVMQKMGLALQDHLSQPLTAQLVRHADLIVTMTRGHRQAILTEWPGAADRTVLLRRDEMDIADPIGGPYEEYFRCAEQIKAELQNLVDELAF